MNSIGAHLIPQKKGLGILHGPEWGMLPFSCGNPFPALPGVKPRLAV